MPAGDRTAKLEEAKAIGRAAYRLVRQAKIEGYIEVDDGRKLIREWERGYLSIKLHAAASVIPDPEEFSQLRVHHAGRKVLDIRWNEAGVFKVVVLERGEWEQSLKVTSGQC